MNDHDEYRVEAGLGIDLDSLDLFTDPDWPPAPVVEREPRKCKRHDWQSMAIQEQGKPETFQFVGYECRRCGKPKDEARARRGKQSRNYGNRAELAVARKYGGEKVGHAGGPVDVRGKDFNTQVKTHRRTPPREWVGVFNALDANRERCPRLLLRFVMGAGVAPRDYFVFQAEDFLSWFGRDEEAGNG